MVTAALLAVPAVRVVTHAGTAYMSASVVKAFPGPATPRTFTVPQPVSAVNVDSYGGPVRITAGAAPRVEVTETIAYDKNAGGPPALTDSVSGGRLTLADPACDAGGCEVGFTLTVPRDTAVTVSSGGGPVVIDGLSGTLTADSGGGLVDAQGLTPADVTVTTGGGPSVLGFGAAPRTVTVSSNGGSARIGVPGGPYALTANSGGGLESVEVATDPKAGRTLTVSTAGGPVLIAPSVPGVARPAGGLFLTAPGPDGPPAPVPPVPPKPQP